MCGRFACTLAPEEICKSCSRKTKSNKSQEPTWRDAPGSNKYYSSYNIAPGSFTPVLVSEKHFSEDLEKTEESVKDDKKVNYVVQPMRWGLVPFWHKGESIKSVGYNMINCRSDTMESKNAFSVPLKKGKRCVVLLNGYYEWQEKNDVTGKKQPFFITNKSSEEKQSLLTVAGIFDTWKPKDGEDLVNSYTIITVDAHEDLKWLHNRMPAILKNDKEVYDWLENGELSLIRPINEVNYHPVSSAVNTVSNKGEDCAKEVELKKPEESASSKFMSNWLKRKSNDKEIKEEVKEKIKKEEIKQE
ncbi:DgyrCDS10830 [Dimorphilus gyrociliatus]|uniref:Abasic site processing protein HMCES n=1 Tax=Dimorphilus gyrociliatus TaxID=2664684 RepID=A0A7I8W2K7_9ANNE|nr:DgyrCDS10830 [Dimorphilus gyrociliatus]